MAIPRFAEFLWDRSLNIGPSRIWIRAGPIVKIGVVVGCCDVTHTTHAECKLLSTSTSYSANTTSSWPRGHWTEARRFDCKPLSGTRDAEFQAVTTLLRTAQ